MKLARIDRQPPRSLRIRIDARAVDDLPCVLNPVQVADLTTVMELTQSGRRPAVLLAFLDWSQETWGTHAGVGKYNLGRWLRGEYRLPLGGAMRLAKVVGQAPDVLFKDWA